MKANENNKDEQPKDNLLQLMKSKYIRQNIFGYLPVERLKKLYKSYNKQLSNDLLKSDEFRDVPMAATIYIVYLNEMLIKLNQDMYLQLFNDIFDADIKNLEAKLASLNDENLNNKFVFVDKIQSKSLRLWIKMLSIERIAFEILSLKEEDFRNHDLLKYFPVKNIDDLQQIIKHVVASKSEARINKIIDKINTDNPYDDDGCYKYEIQTFDSYATESSKNFDECENREVIWLNLCETLVGQTSYELNKNYRIDPNAGWFAMESGFARKNLTCRIYQSKIEQNHLGAWHFYKDNLTLRKIILDLFSFKKECQAVNSDVVQSNKERSEKLKALCKLRDYKRDDYDKDLNGRLTFCRNSGDNGERLDDESRLQKEYKAMLAVVLTNNPEKIMGITSQKLLASAKIALDAFHNGEKEYLSQTTKYNQTPDLLADRRRRYKHCNKYYEKYFEHQIAWDEVKIKLDEAVRSLSPFLSSSSGLSWRKKENIYREWQNKIKEKRIVCNEMLNSTDFMSLQAKFQVTQDKPNTEKLNTTDNNTVNENTVHNQSQFQIIQNKSNMTTTQINTSDNKIGSENKVHNQSQPQVITKNSSLFKWLSVVCFVILACEIPTMLILILTGIIELNLNVFLISLCIVIFTFLLGYINLMIDRSKNQTTPSEITVTKVDVIRNPAYKNINQTIKQNVINQKKVPTTTQKGQNTYNTDINV